MACSRRCALQCGPTGARVFSRARTTNRLSARGFVPPAPYERPAPANCAMAPAQRGLPRRGATRARKLSAAAQPASRRRAASFRPRGRAPRACDSRRGASAARRAAAWRGRHARF
eukprot:5800087-Lingulodinium_polyedra.AAC.2